MATQKRRTRMYEPWGYQDENNYKSTEILVENDFDAFLVDTSYNKDDNKIYFTNKDGEVKATLDVNEFVKSDSIIEKTEYSDGILKIYFTNGDVITINLSELLDENEFKDGLIVDSHVIKVLIDSTGDPYLSVSEDGVKLDGVKAEIERLDDRIDDEITRATGEEERIEGRLDQEIQDRINDVDAEEARAKTAEQTLTTNLNTEVTRAKQTEQQINSRVDVLNDELDAEESTRESNDAALSLRITTEVNDMVAAVNAEKARAEAAETALQGSIEDEGRRAQTAESNLNLKIEAESERAIQKEIELDERIDEIISGSPVEQLDELIEKLGYKDNDTLVTTNEHEVAFGEWNISNTDIEASGQTVFSIGIGTSAHDRKNALEVRKDDGIYAWIEGEFMNINQLLGQISHEVYDTDSNP
ncbi:MAG: hypothetical protein J6O49_09205 [Bacteroidaceae bacterium]|nr:hypothetical protein [Bacteroidaceae bacterium]